MKTRARTARRKVNELKVRNEIITLFKSCNCWPSKEIIAMMLGRSRNRLVPQQIDKLVREGRVMATGQRTNCCGYFWLG